MAHRIITGDPREFNKGRGSKFREGSWIWQTPEEGRRTYRPKRFGNNKKDKDNSPKTLNDKNYKRHVSKVGKVSDCGRERLKGSLFISYYTEV